MNRDNSYLKGNQFAALQRPNATAFRDGQEPWNKGITGLHLSPSTEFKKGQPSVNRLPVGSITVRKCKPHGRLRQFIKQAEPKQWCELAKHLWVESFGKLIPGDIVHHINGDAMDDRIENLIALPRSDHPIFHGRWGIKELTKEQISFYRGRYK